MRTLTCTLLVLSALILQGCESEIEQYESSWAHRAHALQRQLDRHQPLGRATFIGTHNSYNAAAYTTPQSYYDPNQYHSLTNQLRMGVRALELDVHSFYHYDMEYGIWEPDLLLCHGTDAHIGCSPFDRPLVHGLVEIWDWLRLPENADEVLLLYIEDHTSADDNYKLVESLLGTFGAHIYLPGETGCNLIPADLTKADVQAAGKNVVIVSDGCSGSWVSYGLFGGFADSSDDTGYPTVSLADVSPSPQCLDGRYDLATFVRVQEDRTLLSTAVGSAGGRITPARVTDLLDCEINLIGLDKLTPLDGRLAAAVWSWAENQPLSEDVQRCALHNGAARFESAECALQLPFACRDPYSGEWAITNTAGDWEAGSSACDALAMDFTTPFSSFDNHQLQQAKTAAGIHQAWLGYHQDQDDQWRTLP